MSGNKNTDMTQSLPVRIQSSQPKALVNLIVYSFDTILLHH